MPIPRTGKVNGYYRTVDVDHAAARVGRVFIMSDAPDYSARKCDPVAD
jgi:hypothetical protein